MLSTFSVMAVSHDAVPSIVLEVVIEMVGMVVIVGDSLLVLVAVGVGTRLILMVLAGVTLGVGATSEVSVR